MKPTNKLRWLKHRQLIGRYWLIKWHENYYSTVTLQQWWADDNGNGEWRQIPTETKVIK